MLLHTRIVLYIWYRQLLRLHGELKTVLNTRTINLLHLDKTTQTVSKKASIYGFKTVLTSPCKRSKSVFVRTYNRYSFFDRKTMRTLFNNNIRISIKMFC